MVMRVDVGGMRSDAKTLPRPLPKREGGLVTPFESGIVT